MALILAITNAGRAALRNADASGTRAVRIASVGVSAAALAATVATAALPGEIKRITTVSGAAVAADIIHLTVSDETMTTYTVRSFALYLDDGTLFAAYGQADPIIEKSAQALMVLTVDVTLADITASQITFGDANFLMPPATVDRQGLIELATLAEAKAGTDATRAVTPATAKGSLLDWIGYSPANRAGDTFTGSVTVRSYVQDSALRIAQAGTGYGFVQFGEAANANVSFNWHMGSLGDGSFALYQGLWGSGVQRLHVTSAGISFNGGTIWHANNDGAGSGLDADLLDGLQATSFIRADQSSTLGIDVALDFPNSAFGRTLRIGGNGYTAAGTRASVIATNGNLHLDGAAGYTVLLNFYAGDGVTFGNGAGAAAAFMSKAGALNATSVDALIMNRRGVPVVGFDNDGAGSGLDADLLDGRQGSDYALLTGAAFTGPVTARHFTPGPALRVAEAGSGYGFIQYGEAANANVSFNWHMGSLGDGSFALYQGMWGSGVQRLHITSAGISFNGGTIWHANNDGAGSGLDADMLDGLQAAQFVRSDVPSQLATNVSIQFINSTFGRALRIGGDGYTIAGAGASVVTTNGNLHLDGATGYRVFLNHYAGDGVNFGNGAGVVVASMSKDGALIAAAVDAGIMRRGGTNLVGFDNDGAGSGLDADLLDGQDGSWYGNIPARLGYTPANRAGDTFTGPVDIRHGGIQCGLRVSQAGTGYGFVQLGEAANVSWHLGSNGDGTAVLYQGVWGSGVQRLAVSSTTISYNGGAMWHAGNDGAGSGLDADLLDGQDGSFYTAIAARLGYTPANRTGDTFTGPVGIAGTAKFLSSPFPGSYLQLNDGTQGIRLATTGGVVIEAPTGVATTASLAVAGALTRAGFTVYDTGNDGAGSGLDADLLDGRQATDFALLAGADFAGLTRGGNAVWDVGNDGAGSGLDADLLDGRQADEFSRVTAQSLNPTGYRVHADGFKECWGSSFVAAVRDTFIPFPTPHEAWCVPVGSAARPAADEANIGVFSVDLASGGFIVRNRNTEGVTFYWHTRGV